MVWGMILLTGFKKVWGMTLVYSNENFPIDCLQIELRYNVQPIDMCVGVMPPTSFSFMRLVVKTTGFSDCAGDSPFSSWWLHMPAQLAAAAGCADWLDRQGVGHITWLCRGLLQFSPGLLQLWLCITATWSPVQDVGVPLNIVQRHSTLFCDSRFTWNANDQNVE